MSRPRIPRGAEGLLAATERADAGDEAALEAWFRDGYPLLLQACSEWTGHPDLSERVTMGVVRAALSRCRRGLGSGSERAWMARVAELQHHQALWRDRPIDEPVPEGLLDPGLEPLEAAVREEARETVRKAIDGLPTKHRRMMRSRYVRGSTEAEVAASEAEETGLGPGGTHRILREGREMVAACLRGADPRRLWPHRFNKSEEGRTPTGLPPEY